MDLFSAWIVAHGEAIGWFATGLFTLSFFFKSEVGLLRGQLIAASVWVVYGLGVHSNPVVVANLLVALASAFKQVRLWRRSKGTPSVSRSAAAPAVV